MAAAVAPIGTQFSQLAEAAPDVPAVTCDGRTLTRGELEVSTNRLARAYAELGVRQGDYVTIVMPNSIEWVQAVLATWKLGAIPQPLSARLPDTELAGLLALRQPSLLVGRDDPNGKSRSIAGDYTPDPTLSAAAHAESVSPVWKSMSSGGSTGRPKLIEAGGDSRLPAAAGYALGAQEGDVQLMSVPLTHNTGFTTFAIGLIQGHHLVVMPRFEPREFLDLVTKHGVTFLATVPTIMQRLLPVYRAAPDGYDLSSIRRFWHLASPCPPAVKEAWIDLLGPEVIWELYGGTELQALTFINGAQWLEHRGSVGIVVAGEMKVLDDDGNECPPGVVGEIYMRPSPGSAPTYRYIGATAKSRDGWDSLGDLGYFDEDRFLYLNDRRWTCSPSAAGTSTPPRSNRRCRRIRRCCPAWWLACPMPIWARCLMRSCRPTVLTKPPSRRSWQDASPRTRCRTPSSSATPRYATTQARRDGRQCATRSSRDGRLRRVSDRAIKRRWVVPSLPAP